MVMPISNALCTSSTISLTLTGTWGVISFVGIIPVGVKLTMRSIFILSALSRRTVYSPPHGGGNLWQSKEKTPIRVT